MTERRTMRRALLTGRDVKISSPLSADEPTLVDARLEALIFRFKPGARREVRRLVLSSPRLADLAVAFPGALYALATARGDLNRRLLALELIDDGAPLKRVADALELPMWLRKLSPEAFEGPLGVLPDADVFSRRIAARLPRSRVQSPRWLAAVNFVADAAGHEAALWIAEQPIYEAALKPSGQLNVLAAYIWFSHHPEHAASRLIASPFTGGIGFDTAVCAAKSWLNRMRLITHLPVGAITDTWLQGGQALGHTFVPLTHQDEILLEARFMQNCIDQYADPILRGRCRLFSVRTRGTVRVATLEIGLHAREQGVLTITQLKGRRNIPASLEVWQAAYHWLSTQNALNSASPCPATDRPIDTPAWALLMAPYRAAQGGGEWIPRAGTLEDFATMAAGLAEIARRGQVTSWLFA